MHLLYWISADRRMVIHSWSTGTDGTVLPGWSWSSAKLSTEMDRNAWCILKWPTWCHALNVNFIGRLGLCFEDLWTTYRSSLHLPFIHLIPMGSQTRLELTPSPILKTWSSTDLLQVKLQSFCRNKQVKANNSLWTVLRWPISLVLACHPQKDPNSLSLGLSLSSMFPNLSQANLYSKG